MNTFCNLGAVSDAPSRGADALLVAVVVDSRSPPDWVTASIAALSDRFAQVVVSPLQAEDAAERARILSTAALVVDLTRNSDIEAEGSQLVLSVRHGATPAAAPRVLLRELFANRSTVTSSVSAKSAGTNSTVVATARTGLSRRSLAESRRRVAAKVPSLILRGLDTARASEPRPALPEHACEPIEIPALVGGAVRLAGGLVRSALTALTTTANYEVAFGAREATQSPMVLPRDMHWVDHPHDRFLADPFLAREDGTTFVFVEDYSRRRGYATIGVFEPSDPAATFRTVLDRGKHMSYPFVFQDEHTGDWLMLPETAAERRITLFRGSRFPDEWHEDTVLLDDVSAYDPTLFQRDGTYWLFYASGTPGSAHDDELHLATAETLRGPYHAHPWSPLKSDVIGSRPAGRLFDWQGRLIRPAQDSSTEYGYAVVFQEVTELSPTRYAEQPIGRLAPDWAPGLRGTHSLDFLDDVVVADAKRTRPKPGLWRLSRAEAR